MDELFTLGHVHWNENPRCDQVQALNNIAERAETCEHTDVVEIPVAIEPELTAKPWR